MTKSKDLSKHSLAITFQIIKQTAPTNTVRLMDKIDQYITDESIYLEDEELKFLIEHIQRNLRKYIDNRYAKGSLPKFDFSTTDDTILIGLAKKDPLYETFPDYYYYLIAMNDQLFEKFSAAYVKLHYCDFAIVTRKSGDGGIDFLGQGVFKKLFKLDDQSLTLKNSQLTFKIVGQSKRYKPENPIGPKEIREFYGSVKILQSSMDPNYESAWRGQKDILNYFKLADPFIYTFITTSYFSDEAIILSDKIGIYLYDIDDLVFDMIINKIGLVDNKFSSLEFNAWIDKES